MGWGGSILKSFFAVPVVGSLALDLHTPRLVRPDDDDFRMTEAESSGCHHTLFQHKLFASLLTPREEIVKALSSKHTPCVTYSENRRVRYFLC